MNGVNNTNYTLYYPKKKKSNLIWVLYGLIFLLVALICLTVFLGINKETTKTRTFMIYMVGADLESEGSMATYELNGIDPKKVDLENVNVVLIAGGAKKWQNNYIDGTETSIYELTKDGFKKVKQQEIKNMGDYTTLANFINYAYNRYVTDEYSLLFWNHGGAILGSEYDELSNNDNLSLEEISNALSKTSFNKDNKLETVIFGTCLNGTIENANVFEDYARYFVASEEVSMSVRGTSDFSFINDVTPEITSFDIAKAFIAKYKEKINYLKEMYELYNEEYNVYSTYSVVDLTNLSSLKAAVNDFFNEIDLTRNYPLIARTRSNLYQYAYNLASDPSYDMVDLYNLVFQLKSIAPDKASKVLSELEKTVLYNYSTDDSSRGMSIYFPYNADSLIQSGFLKMYDSISPIVSYNKFINEFATMKKTNAQYQLSFIKNSGSANKTETAADIELELTEEQIENYAKAQYYVFRDKKDGTFYPIYKGSEVTLEGNKLKANVKDRQLKVVEDGEGSLITAFEDEVTDSYIKYKVIVALQDLSNNNISGWRFANVTMHLILDKKTNTVSIGSILLNNNDSLLNGVVVDINEYTNAIFGSSSYKILNEDGTFNENFDSNGIFEGVEVHPGKFKFEVQDKYDEDYDYYGIFRIYDINNNHYYSKLIKIN